MWLKNDCDLSAVAMGLRHDSHVCVYICEYACVYKSQALSISCKLTCNASSLSKTLDTRSKYISRFWIFRNNFIFWYQIHLSSTMGKKMSLNFTYLFCVFLKYVRCGQYGSWLPGGWFVSKHDYIPLYRTKQ